MLLVVLTLSPCLHYSALGPMALNVVFPLGPCGNYTPNISPPHFYANGTQFAKLKDGGDNTYNTTATTTSKPTLQIEWRLLVCSASCHNAREHFTPIRCRSLGGSPESHFYILKTWNTILYVYDSSLPWGNQVLPSSWTFVLVTSPLDGVYIFIQHSIFSFSMTKYRRRQIHDINENL